MSRSANACLPRGSERLLGALLCGWVALLTTGASALAATPSIALDWRTVAGKRLAQVAAGNMRFVLGLDRAGKVWRYQGGSWKAAPSPSGAALSDLAAGADGAVFGTTRDGKSFRLEGSAWKVLAGKVRQISAGDGKNVWGLGAAGAIFRLAGATWKAQRGPKLKHLSAASDGAVWGVGTKGEVYRRRAGGKGWERMAGQLSQVAVGKDGVVAGIAAGGSVVRWKKPQAFTSEILGPARVGSCGADRRATGTVWANVLTCRAMGGRVNGNPPATAWVDCFLEWCVARPGNGVYTAAPVGGCRKKVGYGAVGMQAASCREIGGAFNGEPKDADWIRCHLDWCQDPQPRIVGAKPGTCGRAKVGYGPFLLTAGDCRKIGGRMNERNPPAGQWVGCHLDWCDATAWAPVRGATGARSVSLTPSGELWATGAQGQAMHLNLIAYASVDDKAQTAGAAAARRLGAAKALMAAVKAQVEVAVRKEGANAVLITEAEGRQQAALLGQALADTLGNLGLYTPAPVRSCGGRKRGYGIIHMSAADCQRMGGGFNEKSPAPGRWLACHFDWCVAAPGQGYSAAKPGGCGPSAQIGYGYVRMPAGQCSGIGGRMNERNPPPGQWINCHLAWCRERTLRLVFAGPGSKRVTGFHGRVGVKTIPGWCQTPIQGYGGPSMAAESCLAMGGNYDANAGPKQWTDCYFDVCQYKETALGKVDPFVRRLIDEYTASLRDTPLLGKRSIGNIFKSLLTHGEGRINAEWQRRAAAARRAKEAQVRAQLARQLASMGPGLGGDVAKARADAVRKVWQEARRLLGGATASTPAPSSAPRTGALTPASFAPPGAACPNASAGAGPKVPLRQRGLWNLARLRGAKVTASSLIPGYPGRHQIAFLNDGWYGNCRSWIPAREPSWVEVDLGSVHTISRVTLGSDHTQRFRDRAASSLRIKVLGPSRAVVAAIPHGRPVSRTQAFRLPRPVRGRFVRVEIDRSVHGPARIDEIEVWGR